MRTETKSRNKNHLVPYILWQNKVSKWLKMYNDNQNQEEKNRWALKKIRR